MRELIERHEAAISTEDHAPEGELTEAERAQKAIIVKTADAMVNSPGAMRYLKKLPLDGYEMQLQQTIEAILTQILQAKGVGVSGGAGALRAIRGLSRGTLPTG